MVTSLVESAVHGQLATPDAAENIQKIYKLVKDTINGDMNEQEFQLFMHDCKRQNVHPLDRLIHPTIRVDKKTGNRRYVPITSIDLFRARAEEAGGYAGSDDPVFKGSVGKDDFQATVTVYKIVEGVRCPFSATARWTEYFPGPPHDFMWRKMPHGQLGKCAEALALRKAYPRKLHGLYERAEMDQADSQQEIKATPAKVVDAPAPEPLVVVDANPFKDMDEKHDLAKADGYMPEPQQIEVPKLDPEIQKIQEQVIGKQYGDKIPQDASVMLVEIKGYNPKPRPVGDRGGVSYSLRVLDLDGDGEEQWASTFNKDAWETGKLLKGQHAHLTYKIKNGYLNFFHVEKAGT